MNLTGRKGPPAPPDAKPTPERPRSHLDMLLAGAREHVDVVVPRTDIRGRMRLVSRSEASWITADTRKHFEALEMPTDPAKLGALGLLGEWSMEIAVRHLHVAVRDPADESKPLVELGLWRECDDDQIATLWEQYQDLCDRVDPFGATSRLTERERDEIVAALGKRNAAALRAFGSRRLSLFMLSTAEQPAS